MYSLIAVGAKEYALNLIKALFLLQKGLAKFSSLQIVITPQARQKSSAKDNGGLNEGSGN